MPDSDVVSVVIFIGNSDNKLTQASWSEFIDRMTAGLMAAVDAEPHFIGATSPFSVKQSACFCVSATAGQRRTIQILCRSLAIRYGQDSICVVAGEPVFIGV